MIHKRKFIYELEFRTVADLIPVLQTIEADARREGYYSPAVEMQTDGDASFARLWEETLSDGSKQLVVMFA